MPRQNTKDFGRILKCPLRPHHRFQNFRFPRATLQNPKVGSWTEGQIPESQYSAQYEEQNPVCKIQLLCGGIAVAEFENQISSAVAVVRRFQTVPTQMIRIQRPENIVTSYV